MDVLYKLRRDTATNWYNVNPILADGEIGFEKDTGKMKVGDGTLQWNSRPYVIETATTADIADSLNRRYITDNQKAGLGLMGNGIVTLPTLTNNGDGSITLGSDGVINFYKTSDALGGLVQISSIAGASFTLTDNAINYIYASYNSGSPVYAVSLSSSSFLTDGTLSPVYRIIREGATLHIIDYDNYGVSLSGKQFYKDISLNMFQRQSGLTLSTTATRISTVSEGSAWFGVKLYSLSANIAGSSGELEEYYLVSGIWNRQAVTSYDSIYYSNGTNRLLLSGNNWVAKYFFRGIETDNEVYFVHGNSYTSSSGALSETVPSLPSVISGHALYVGKIVIQRNATNGTAYPRDWGITLATVGVTNHEDLANIYQAVSGVTNGHISDQSQTIAGAKTFSGGINTPSVSNISFINANTIIGSQSQLPTTATDGFTYIPTCAGIPSGIPTSYTGKVAIVYDTVNNKLYCYNNGWKGASHT